MERKAVVITGGSSGIGEAAAKKLAALGARLALVARKADGLERVKAMLPGVEVHTIPADVGDAEQARQAVETAAARLGGLDIVLNSAGVSMRGMVESSTVSAMETVMRVNFLGVVNITQAALPYVIRSKGSLVALGSLAGKRAIPSYAAYGASKAAVHLFFETLRIELKPHGVHVGVVAPAFVDTPLRSNVLGPDGKPWSTPPEPPFRVWPVELVADKIVRLIAKRQRQALLPAFCGPLLVVDQMLGQRLGDHILGRRFPRDKNNPPKDGAD